MKHYYISNNKLVSIELTEKELIQAISGNIKHCTIISNTSRDTSYLVTNTIVQQFTEIDNEFLNDLLENDYGFAIAHTTSNLIHKLIYDLINVANLT